MLNKIIFIIFFLVIAVAKGKDTISLTLEVYRLPISDRAEIGDAPADKLINEIKSKGAKLLYRCSLSANNNTRCKIEDGTKISILSDWNRDDSGKLVPVFSEVVIGIVGEFEVSYGDEKSPWTSIDYNLTYRPKPPQSLRGGVKITDKDTAMEFNYDVPAIQYMTAVGSFLGSSKGSHILFESVNDGSIETMFVLNYKVLDD